MAPPVIFGCDNFHQLPHYISELLLVALILSVYCFLVRGLGSKMNLNSAFKILMNLEKVTKVKKKDLSNTGEMSPHRIMQIKLLIENVIFSKYQTSKVPVLFNEHYFQRECI